MVLTDGTLHVAENGGNGGAYWLMDAIASYQPQLRKSEHWDTWASGLQVWTLKKMGEDSAVLACKDDQGASVITQEIEYTDFDLEEITLWVMPADANTWVIMLPSEY
ncbi:MAG: hypothetical protein LHW56_11545 [Candidatus Cloacimonetes bacterium]|nr:hypothetical protein [Candidatus Cloacimonadota bacterium]MDY0173521.1 hypothetical protein [Candidatus Cloacimonadaceae bacterium]